MSSAETGAALMACSMRKTLSRWVHWAIRFAAFMVLTTIGYVVLPPSEIYGVLVPVVAGVVVAAMSLAVMRSRK